MGTVYIPPENPIYSDVKNGNEELIINDYNTNESRSKSENQNNLSGSLSNVAIQNVNTGYFGYEYGVKVPTTTLNLSLFGDEYNFGGQATLAIPLGKKQKKLAYEQINTRIRQNNINNIGRELSVCANVEKAGYEIIDYDGLGLSSCTLIAKRSPLEQTSEIKQLIKEQRETIKKQQVLIQKLLVKIDNIQIENNSPFESNG